MVLPSSTSAKHTASMDLPEEQRRDFADNGLLTLRRAVPEAVRRPLHERVQNAVTLAEGIDDPARRRKRVSRALKRRLDGIYTEDLAACARELMAGDIVDCQAALLLMTLPGQSVAGPVSEWTIPPTHWHTDAPRVTGRGVPGIIMLSFLDTVAPGGGGTLFVAGSHRLLDAPGRELRSKAFRKALKRKPYFDILLGTEGPRRTRFLEDRHCVDGVDVRLVELTGEPGDVVFADARLLHAPAPNVRPTPRLMVRGFFVGEPLADHYRAAYPAYASRVAAADS